MHAKITGTYHKIFTIACVSMLSLQMFFFVIDYASHVQTLFTHVKDVIYLPLNYFFFHLHYMYFRLPRLTICTCGFLTAV